MQVASSSDSEIQITLEVMVDVVNGLDEADALRTTLAERGFARAPSASDASIQRLRLRLRGLVPLFRLLPEVETAHAAALVNEQLTELNIAPAVVDHDGVGPHIHWTPSTATFDDQVVADVLMALAQELCDNGTARLGRCGASNCDDLFYDGSRNRSRRFCADPKCSSRTHTAEHRARQRAQ